MARSNSMQKTFGSAVLHSAIVWVVAVFLTLPLSLASAKTRTAEIQEQEERRDRCYADGDYKKARDAAQRVYELTRLEFEGGRCSEAQVAEAMNDLAVVLDELIDYEHSETLYLQALKVRERVGRAKDVAITLNNLAEMYESKGEPQRVEPLYKRAIELLEHDRHPDSKKELPSMLGNLSIFYKHLGDYEQAESLGERALRLSELVFGKEDAKTGILLDDMALLCLERGSYEQAKSYAERALQIFQKKGSSQIDRNKVLLNLSGIYTAQGRLTDALAVGQAALSGFQRKLGLEHPLVADALAVRSRIFALTGKLTQAEDDLRHALAIREAALGKEHLEVGMALMALGEVLAALGRDDEAVAAYLRVLSIKERVLRQVRIIAKESTTVGFLKGLREDEDQIYAYVATHLQNPNALRLGITTALMRKGRSEEEAADFSRTLLHELGPEAVKKYEHLLFLKGQLARIEMRGGKSSEAPNLLSEIQQVEQELSYRSRSFWEAQKERADVRDVLARVKTALVPRGALVEVAAYRERRPFVRRDTQAGLAVHYLAMVLQHSGSIQGHRLGPAAEIEPLIEDFLREVTSPPSTPGAELPVSARALYTKIFEPLVAILDGKRQIVLSLDKQLNMVPFAALHDGKDYLIGRYHFSYLTSGRDLLRQMTHRTNPWSTVIIAAPARPQQQELIYAPLEARNIKVLISSALIMLGEQATRLALLSLKAPGILHIAAHGRFLGDSRMIPMLRSLLLMAMEIRAGSTAGDADGQVSALDIAGMDLWGTRLVVLSACQSGVGSVDELGQGVYGIRRGFIVAGAETLVASLWNVEDQVAPDLMKEYYSLLVKGRGRLEAMEEAARRVKARLGHPYYWAQFIVHGQTGPIPELRAEADIASRRGLLLTTAALAFTAIMVVVLGRLLQRRRVRPKRRV